MATGKHKRALQVPAFGIVRIDGETAQAINHPVVQARNRIRSCVAALICPFHVHFICWIILTSQRMRNFPTDECYHQRRKAPMRIILATVGALGLGLIGVSDASAIPINAASIDTTAGANSPMIKVTSGGGHHFGRWPSCEHLRSFNPQTRTFIGSDGRRHPCVRPHGH